MGSRFQRIEMGRPVKRWCPLPSGRWSTTLPSQRIATRRELLVWLLLESGHFNSCGSPLGNPGRRTLDRRRSRCRGSGRRDGWPSARCRAQPTNQDPVGPNPRPGSASAELGECLFEGLACGQCIQERGAGLDRQPSLRHGPHMIAGIPPIRRRDRSQLQPATQRASVPCAE